MGRGLLLVISGPGGAGKGTICSALTKKRSDIYFSVSATSRAPRADDIEGQTYFFKSVKEFEEMIKNGELLEWVEFCGNYYGTPKQNIEEKLQSGMHVLLDFETKGAFKFKENFPDSVLIFIIPPNYQALIDRFHKRGVDSEERIRERLLDGLDQLQKVDKYDYIVVNDEVEKAVKRVEAIIEAEQNRPFRHKDEINKYVNSIKEAGIL
jgi:guanylate kinase